MPKMDARLTSINPKSISTAETSRMTADKGCDVCGRAGTYQPRSLATGYIEDQERDPPDLQSLRNGGKLFRIDLGKACRKL